MLRGATIIGGLAGASLYLPITYRVVVPIVRWLEAILDFIRLYTVMIGLVTAVYFLPILASIFFFSFLSTKMAYRKTSSERVTLIIAILGGVVGAFITSATFVLITFTSWG